MAVNLAAFWLRWRVWILAGAGAVLTVAFIWQLAAARAAAVWRERAAVADSTAKQEQKNRLRTEQALTAARTVAASLDHAVHDLTEKADSAAAVARTATHDAERYRNARDAAIRRLALTATHGDTIAALVAQTVADDSLLAADSATIAAQTAETGALRSALDSANAARTLLAVALDSARVQLKRDGQTIQSLQVALAAAKPKAPRTAKLAITAGVGYCEPGAWCAAVIVGPSLRVF